LTPQWLLKNCLLSQAGLNGKQVKFSTFMIVRNYVIFKINHLKIRTLISRSNAANEQKTGMDKWSNRRNSFGFSLHLQIGNEIEQ
jgi:hypothetical protein